MRLPERIYLGSYANFSVDHTFERRQHEGEGERLMCFVLPPFQRPPVWTKKQSVAFLESLILGLPIGTYTYCLSIRKPKTDGWLIDGQQRMRAIQSFIASEIAVFGFKWRGLTKPEQLRIRNTVFPAYVLEDATEEECLERYIKLNYTGTAHTAADKRRAKRMQKKLTTEGKQ